MPAAIPAIAAAWASVSAAAATVASALAFKAGIVAGLAAWGKVALVTTVLSTALMLKPPGLGSQGQQVNIQMAGPAAALPWAFGRTGTQGIITHRTTYGSSNDTLLVEHVLSVGPVDAIESFSVMGRALSYSGNPNTGMATVTQVAGVDMRTSKLFRYDGLRVAFRTGQHNDTSTLNSITGDFVPDVNSSHTMQGLARGILRCKLDEKRLNFPNGYPDDPIWVLRGARCYDGRKDTTRPGGSGSHRVNDSSTHEWSENPFIVALQFALGVRSPNGEVMFGLGIDPDMIDIPAFMAAANVADANNWKVGGQVISTDDEWPAITNILASGGGVPIDKGGKLSVFVRSPKVATFTLAASEVLGSRRLTTSTPMAQRFNRIVPSCRQASQKWELIAGEPVADPTWLAQDGGEVRTEEISFPLVNDFRQAHQLAAYYACDAREFIETEITAKPRALNVDVGDCIRVELPEFAPGQTFIVMGRKWNPDTKQVTLNLKAETFAKHAFCLGQSQVAPTPPTLNRFDPNQPAAPAVADWGITDNKLIQTRVDIENDENGNPVEIVRDQAVIPAIVVSGAVRDPNVQRVLVEYREPLTGEETIPAEIDAIDFGWTFGAEGPRTTADLVISGLRPNTMYEASVTYETLRGVFSARRVLGTVTTAQDRAGGVGPGVIDWTDPPGTNPITNIPPALRDLDQGKIRAEFIAIEGEVTKTLDEVITDTKGRIEDAWDVLGGSENEGLRYKVAQLESSGPDGELVGRVEGLEVKLNGANGQPGALARLLNAEQAIIEANQGIATKAAASALNALSAALDSEKGRIDATNNRLNTVEATANGAVTSAQLNAVSATVTTERDRITATNSRLDQVKVTADGAATSEQLGQLALTVNGHTNQISTINQVSIDANNRSKSIVGFVQNNGIVSGMKSENDGVRSRISFQQDVFEVIPSAAGGAGLAFTGTEGLKLSLNGQTRIWLGFRNV